MPVEKAKQVCLPFLLDEIPDPGSRAFHVSNHVGEVEGFVVRKAQHVYAYRNACPHTGVMLNWSEDVFLDCNEEMIQCAMHGALFSIEDGHCVWGPCQGASLEKIGLTVDGKGRLFIEI